MSVINRSLCLLCWRRQDEKQGAGQGGFADFRVREGGGRERVLGSVDTRATWEDGRDTWEVRGWGGARRQDSGIGCEGT